MFLTVNPRQDAATGQWGYVILDHLGRAIRSAGAHWPSARDAIAAARELCVI